MRRAAVTLIALLVLAGCVSSESGGGLQPEESHKAKREKTAEAEPAAKCIDLKKSTLRDIRVGLRKKSVKIAEGAAVKVANPELGMDYIAALKFKDSGDHVGLLSMGSIEAGGGLWVVADGTAREYLDWGDLAKADSPMGEAIAAAASSPEADAARDCLD